MNNYFSDMSKNFAEMTNAWTKNSNFSNMYNMSNMNDMMNPSKFLNNDSLTKIFQSQAACIQAAAHTMTEGMKRQMNSNSEMFRNISSGNNKQDANLSFVTSYVQKTAQNMMECTKEIAEIFSKATIQNIDQMNNNFKENTGKMQENMNNLKRKVA